jgi:hypothetical protein
VPRLRVLAAQPGRCGLDVPFQDRTEALPDLLHQIVVLEAARRGHDQMLRAVPGPVVLVDLLPRDRVDRLHGAEHRAAQRGVAEQVRGERLVHRVRRIVVVHGDLFEHDVPLGVHVLRGDQ